MMTAVAPLRPCYKALTSRYRRYLSNLLGFTRLQTDKEKAYGGLTMDINDPQFILNSGGMALHMSENQPNGARVSLDTFDGSMNQQWFVYSDADGHVAIMSRQNKAWVGLRNDSVQDTEIIASMIPFWWKIMKYVGGYKLIIPNTNTALSLESTVTVRQISKAKRLYALESSSANEFAIQNGNLPWNKEPENQRVRRDRSDPQTPSISSFNVLDGSDPPSNNVSSASNPGPIPNKSRKGISVFGTSKPKKLVYGHTTQGALDYAYAWVQLIIVWIGLVPTASPGIADIVGFSSEGVTVWLKDKQGGRLVSSSFGYDSAQWRDDKHARLLLADTTGRGESDIIGFHDDGVWISVNNGDKTFRKPKKVSSDFSSNKGWRVEKHFRLVADIRNIGRADIVGFGNQGVYVALNNGDGTFGSAQLVVKDQDEKLEHHLRFLADITGNGLLDVIGFASNVYAFLNKGDGTFHDRKVILADFGENGGWYINKHPRFLVDLTGDGLPDILGIKEDGVYAAFNNGDGTFSPGVKVIKDEFCYNKGWRVHQHPRFVADLTGNGCADVIGFGTDGVYVAINNGNGTFQPVKRASKHFGYFDDWRVAEHKRFMVDMTGDGCADIVGIGDNGVYVSYNDGEGNFGPYTFLTSCFGTSQPEWFPHKSLTYVANLSV